MLVVFPDASIPQTANGTKKDTTTGNTSTSIYSPQTGDTTDLSGYVITLIASVTVITGWLILKEENGIKKMTSRGCRKNQWFFPVSLLPFTL